MSNYSKKIPRGAKRSNQITDPPPCVFSSVVPPPPLRVLSALAFWSPVFGEVDYLPHMAFPFAKLFQNNRLLAFEMLATVLSKCTYLMTCCDVSVHLQPL